MGKTMKCVILIDTERIGGNKDRPAGSYAYVASALSYRSCPDCCGRVVPGARCDNDIPAKAKFRCHIFFQLTNNIETLMKSAKHLLIYPRKRYHIIGPALVLNIQKKHSRGIGIVGCELSRQLIVYIVLWKHNLAYPIKIPLLVIPHP